MGDKKLKGDGEIKMRRYLKWYPILFQQATTLLTLQERGLYREILDHLFLNDGYLPMAEKRLRALVRCDKDEWEEWWPAVKGFFDIKNGKITHRIVREQVEWLNERVERARHAANARWDATRSADEDAAASSIAYAKEEEVLEEEEGKRKTGEEGKSLRRGEGPPANVPADVSAEDEPPPDGPELEPIAFMLKSGHKWVLEPDEIREFASSFARDGEPPDSALTWVVAEARKAASWCRVNPRKRKTKVGMRRFLNSWLSRADERLGSARKVRPTKLQAQWDSMMESHESFTDTVLTAEEEREAARQHLASLGLDPDGES